MRGSETTRPQSPTSRGREIEGEAGTGCGLRGQSTTVTYWGLGGSYPYPPLPHLFHLTGRCGRALKGGL
jgi:hypothetical protein